MNEYLKAIYEIEQKENVIFPLKAIKELSKESFEKEYISTSCPSHANYPKDFLWYYEPRSEEKTYFACINRPYKMNIVDNGKWTVKPEVN